MSNLEQLINIMAQLRGPAGCPWDKEQTHQSLKPYLIEEAYELLEAIDCNDDGEIKEELGDLLLQVVFHAQIASEENRITIDDVAEAIADKLIRRHPGGQAGSLRHCEVERRAPGLRYSRQQGTDPNG